MIFVTGDTHGYNHFEKLPAFAAEHPELTRADYLIIAGDFGLWDEEALRIGLERYKALPFTVLYVDGNHENFPALNAIPVSEWKGGKVHRILPNLIHLMRGQVYEIEGQLFFTFGGATSRDKDYREEGVDWFPEEIPSDEDIKEANRNLEKHHFKVDYIITHACDEKTLYYPALRDRGAPVLAYPENGILSYFEENVSYKHWYFGHYHTDAEITDKKTALFERVIPLAK